MWMFRRSKICRTQNPLHLSAQNHLILNYSVVTSTQPGAIGVILHVSSSRECNNAEMAPVTLSPDKNLLRQIRRIQALTII